MAGIYQFDTIASYNDFNNHETLHPLVSVIDFGNAKPRSWEGNTSVKINYGFCGMSPGQRSDKGQRGDQQGQQGQGGQGDQGEGEDGFDQADGAMGDATGRLGDGNADGAVDAQGKALDALRKGAQSLAESMQPGDGDGQMDGPGSRAGRQQSGGNQTDPLGRPLHGREFGDDFTVKIPGEIDVERVRRILEELRRRLADPSRPQLELDYIERLLKDY